MLLRTKVILFLGTLLISLAVLVVFNLEFSVRDSFRKQLMANVQIIVKENEAIYYTFVDGLKIRAVDWSSDNYISELAEKIVNEAETQSERSAAVEQYGAYLRDKKMKSDPAVVIVDLLDQNGVVVASSNAKRIGTDELEEEVRLNAHYFSKTINAGIGVVFSRNIVFEKDESDKPMFHITTRLFGTVLDADGKFVPLPAVLLVHFASLQQISDVMSHAAKLVFEVTGKSETEAIHTLETYIVNPGGVVVAFNHAVEENHNIEDSSTYSPLIARCFSYGEDGTAEYVNHHGVPVVGASACIFDDGIAIVTEQESSWAYAIYDDLIQKTIVVGSAIFIVVILLVFFVSGRMVRRFDAIVTVAKKVSSGDFKVRVASVSSDEIGRLATAFNTMLSTIEISHERLSGQALILEKNIKEYEEQAKYLLEAKNEQHNLLEHAWEAKAKLDLEKNRLNTILSSIGEGLILIDGKYIITLVNTRTTEMFSMSNDELIGKDLRTVAKLWKQKTTEIPPEKWPIESALVDKKLITAGLEDDLSITTENHQEHISIAFSIAPLGGDLEGAVIVFHDMTTDRQFDDAKSGFISVASHQLRTPLTTIRWYSEMLLSGDAGDLSEAQRDFLTEIHGGAERLYQTIDLLLGISRVESGRLKFEKIPINLTSFTEDIIKELRPQIDTKKIIFTTVPPVGDDVIVMLDSLTLRQVILNLLSNSINYTNDGGAVEASWVINENKSKLTYSVRDNGIGIPVIHRGRIFSKFFRAENAIKKSPDGSGLGLAFIKGVVESWGGKVWYETAEGKGTTFYFTVPFG